MKRFNGIRYKFRYVRLTLWFALLLLPTVVVLAQSGGGYNLEWNTIDGGGHTFSSGGAYSLGGTIGQPDAGSLLGGNFALSGDCSSWANACTLQTALTSASSGDEIWVKAGVHYPGSNRTDTFQLKNGVAIYGGFAGTETLRDQRAPRFNPTILSGDIDHNDNHGGDYINESYTQIVGNNAYHVVTGSGMNNTAVLDGFIITAGQANGTNDDVRRGGGMLNTSGSPTLNNLTFNGNLATSYGGGMYNYSSSPALTNVTFNGNRGYTGGGMANWVGSNPTLSIVAFNGNSAQDSGGGMANHSGGVSGSFPSLINVIFRGNTAPYHGGGMFNYQSSPTLTNVTFSGNSSGNGGGMNNTLSNPILKNAILWGNSATNGAGIYNNSSTPTISYSDIQGCGGSGTGWQSACGNDGGGNIDANPLFMDPAVNNLHLNFGSPAIDTGTNIGCPAADLDGLPRPTDGNGNNNATCDMGAYEAGAMLYNLNTYTFNDQSGVSIQITTLGNLACLYVDEMALNHPNATPGLQTGRYWLIRGLQSDGQTTASGFEVNLTLPTTCTPDANDKVCRYTGSGQIWDCAMSSYDAINNLVTRNGVTDFSDWAVGDNVGPTAITVSSLHARTPTTAGWLGVTIFFLIGFSIWRFRQPKSGELG